MRELTIHERSSSPIAMKYIQQGIREMYKSEHKGEISHLAIFTAYF